MKFFLSLMLTVFLFQSQSVKGFTQGNLLVLKVGALDGSSAIEGDPSSEDFLTVSYLEEIDINTNTGIPSTRIDLSRYDLLLPSWNGQGSIGAIASGELELTADGMYVTFGAYQGGRINDFAESAPLRVAVRVDSNGNVVTIASISKAAYSKGAIKTVRSVCSVNGKQAWFTGYPNTICYVDSLLPNEPTCVFKENVGFGCSIYNKQLHLTGRAKVAKLGIGLPRETSITTAKVEEFSMDANSNAGSNMFASVWFADDNTMWTCDTTGDASIYSGLYKWIKVSSGTWQRTGVHPVLPNIPNSPNVPPCSDVVGLNSNIYFTVFTKFTTGAAVWKYDTITGITTEILNATNLTNPLTHMYRGISVVPNTLRKLQKGNLLVFRMGQLDGSGPDLKSNSVSSSSIQSAYIDEISPLDGTIFSSIDLDYDVSGFASGFKACGQEGYVTEEGPNAGTLSFTQDGHVLVQYQCGSKGQSPLRIVAAIRPSPLSATAVYVGSTGEPFKNDLFTGACSRTLAEGIYMTGWGRSSGSGIVFAQNNVLSQSANNIKNAAGCVITTSGSISKMVVAGPHLGDFYEYPGLPSGSVGFDILQDSKQLKRYATDFLFIENNGITYLWIADCYFLGGSNTQYGKPGINRYVKSSSGTYTFEKNYLGFAATGIASAIDASGTLIIYATALDYPSYTTSGPSYIVALNTKTEAINVIRASGTSSIQYRGVAIVPDAAGLSGAKTIPEVTPPNPIPMFIPPPSPSPSPSVFAPLTVAVSGMTDGQKGGIAAGVIIGLLLLGGLFQFFCRRGAALAMSKMDDLAASRNESNAKMSMFQLPTWRRSNNSTTGSKAPALPQRRGSRRGSEVEEGENKKKRRASSVAE